MSLFKIKDIHSGWIDGYIREDKKNVEFSYSYMTDFLGDLLEEVLCVLDNKKEFGIIDTEIEPGTDFWKISCNDKKIVISLFLYEKHDYILYTNEDYFKIEKTLINEKSDYDFEFGTENFINNFINEIEDNLDKYNENYLKDCLDHRRTVDDLKKYIQEIKKIIFYKL